MLLLHHDHHEMEPLVALAPTIMSLQTRPVAAEAQGRKLVSTAGVAPAASIFAGWRSDLSELRGQLVLGHLASVIGLAPIRPGLKGRLRELLCIHGRKWSPRLVLRQRLLVFSEALICLSYSGKSSSGAVTLRGLPLIGRSLCF